MKRLVAGLAFASLAACAAPAGNVPTLSAGSLAANAPASWGTLMWASAQGNGTRTQFTVCNAKSTYAAHPPCHSPVSTHPLEIDLGNADLSAKASANEARCNQTNGYGRCGATFSARARMGVLSIDAFSLFAEPNGKVGERAVTQQLSTYVQSSDRVVATSPSSTTTVRLTIAVSIADAKIPCQNLPQESPLFTAVVSPWTTVMVTAECVRGKLALVALDGDGTTKMTFATKASASGDEIVSGSNPLGFVASAIAHIKVADLSVSELAPVSASLGSMTETVTFEPKTTGATLTFASGARY